MQLTLPVRPGEHLGSRRCEQGLQRVLFQDGQIMSLPVQAYLGACTSGQACMYVHRNGVLVWVKPCQAEGIVKWVETYSSEG